MTTMNLSLPADMKDFLEAQAAEEGYPSAGEYLLSVIREVRRRKAKQFLIGKLDEALAGGPAEPMTRQDWDELEREVWERHGRDPSREIAES